MQCVNEHGMDYIVKYISLSFVPSVLCNLTAPHDCMSRYAAFHLPVHVLCQLSCGGWQQWAVTRGAWPQMDEGGMEERRRAAVTQKRRQGQHG